MAYAGDAGHSAVTASDKVDVSRASASLSLNNNGKVYSYGTDVTFTAHLGTTYKNRTVEIWANPYGGDKPNKLVRTGTVSSGGNISAKIDMTRDTEVTAIFKGDARYKSKTVKVTGYAKVKNSTAVTKQYKTAKIGSHSYYWFHKNTDPVLTTTMTYYPGRKQRMDMQVYYSRLVVHHRRQPAVLQARLERQVRRAPGGPRHLRHQGAHALLVHQQLLGRQRQLDDVRLVEVPVLLQLAPAEASENGARP